MLRNDYKPQSIRQSGQLIKKRSPAKIYWFFLTLIVVIIFIIFSLNSAVLPESKTSQTIDQVQPITTLAQANLTSRKQSRTNIPLQSSKPIDDAGTNILNHNAPIGIANDNSGNYPRRSLALSLNANTDNDTTLDKNPNSLTTVTIQTGDSLARIFQKQSIPAKDLQNIMKLGKPVKALTKMMPGTEIQFIKNSQHELVQIRFPLDETDTLIIDKTTTGYKSSTDQLKVETELVSVNGIIKDSLFLSAKNAGLTDNLIMQLAGIFGWDIDFVLDIRKGDRFTVVYEKRFAGGNFLGNGVIVAAEFVNQGKSYRAVQFVDNKGNRNYFTPDGFSMRKAFLRAPLNFKYISSGFQRRRFHPILKRVKPHRGIDYRAPRGTPVYAAGDGKVIRSGYSKYNGNYVFIKHGEKYVTKYLHFSKRKVRYGQRVKQGQTIGYVGMTGLAEAPHLHYEFRVNGVHRNPRTVQLPQARPIDKKHKKLFLASTKTLVSRLNLEDRIYFAQLERQNSQKSTTATSVFPAKTAPH